METLANLFGGGSSAPSAGVGGDLNYLGNAQVPPPDPNTAPSAGGNNPAYGPAQGGPNFQQFFQSLAQNKMNQKGGGMASGGGAGGGSDPNSAAAANAGQTTKGIASALGKAGGF